MGWQDIELEGHLKPLCREEHWGVGVTREDKSEKLNCHQVQGESVELGLQGTACGQMGGQEARGGLEREEDMPLGHRENQFVQCSPESLSEAG